MDGSAGAGTGSAGRGGWGAGSGVVTGARIGALGPYAVGKASGEVAVAGGAAAGPVGEAVCFFGCDFAGTRQGRRLLFFLRRSFFVQTGSGLRFGWRLLAFVAMSPSRIGRTNQFLNAAKDAGATTEPARTCGRYCIGRSVELTRFYRHEIDLRPAGPQDAQVRRSAHNARRQSLGGLVECEPSHREFLRDHSLVLVHMFMKSG